MDDEKEEDRIMLPAREAWPKITSGLSLKWAKITSGFTKFVVRRLWVSILHIACPPALNYIHTHSMYYIINPRTHAPAK